MKETCQLLGKEPYQITYLAKKGAIKKVEPLRGRPLFSKESVEAYLSREQESLRTGLEPHLEFRRARPEDRQASIDLSMKHYGETARHRDPEFDRASEQYHLYDERSLAAMFTCTAITPEGVERFCYDYGWSLTSYFIPFQPGPALECILWFLVTPDVDNKKQLEYYRDFRRALRSIWRAWGERGIHIKCVYVNGMHATHRIHVLLKRMGFKHFSTQGKRMIFCLETSTQTPILKSYQEALAAYKRTHK